MNDPTALGKDFGGMAQGDDKTGQKGTNSVFVMTHKEIDIAKNAGHKWTYPECIKKHARDGFVFLEIRRAVSGLPQAGILANKLLRKRLKPHGYYECTNTPGLWRHTTRPITFLLVVDNFGVKYVGKEHADHLIDCLKTETYKLTED